MPDYMKILDGVDIDFLGMFFMRIDWSTFGYGCFTEFGSGGFYS